MQYRGEYAYIINYECKIIKIGGYKYFIKFKHEFFFNINLFILIGD